MGHKWDHQVDAWVSSRSIGHAPKGVSAMRWRRREVPEAPSGAAARPGLRVASGAGVRNWWMGVRSASVWT